MKNHIKAAIAAQAIAAIRSNTTGPGLEIDGETATRVKALLAGEKVQSKSLQRMLRKGRGRG